MVLKFDRISQNDVKLSPKAWYLQHFLNGSYNTPVTVPAEFSAGIFTFSFVDDPQRTGILANKTEEAIKNILAIVARIDESLSDAKLRQMLMDSQIGVYLGKRQSDKDKDEKFSDSELAELKMLKEELSKKFILSGINNAVLSDVLSQSSTRIALNEYKQISLSGLQDMVNSVQEYYSMYARSLSVEELVSKVTTTLSNDMSITFVRSVYEKMIVSSGPSMSARLSYVQNAVHNAVFGSDYVQVKTVLDNLEYEIDSLENIDDIGYVEAFYGFVCIMRMLMGGPIAKTKSAEVSWKDLAASQVLTSTEFLPFIPADLGEVDEEKMSKFITKRWFLNVLRRLTTHDYGSLMQRIETISDLRKYKRNDAIDQGLQITNVVCSVAWDSLLDVGAEFKMLIEDQNVKFMNLHPVHREKFSKFFFEFLSSFNSYRTPADHPRFLHEPANLINHRVNPVERSVLDFEVPSFAADNVKSQITDAKNLNVIQYLRTDVISGYIGEAKVDIATELLQFAGAYEPIYTSRIARTSLLSTDMFGVLGSIVPLSIIKQRSKIGSRLIQEGNIHVFFNAEAMSNTLRIPLSIAKYIYRSNESTYVVFNRGSQLYLSWPSQLAPIYEENVPSEVTYIKPFLAVWPFLVQRVIQSGIQWSKAPLKVGEKGNPINPVVPPKTPTPDELNPDQPPLT